MRDFATFDCETDPFLYGRIPEPFVWGFKSKKGFEWFQKTSDFVDRLKEFDGIAYAHNGGKFDFHFLFEFLDPQDDIMIINGRIAKMKIGKCEIRDSYLLLPVPLSAYKKDDIDYSLMEKEVRKQNMTAIVTYLKGDCEYLYDLLNINFQDYGQKLTLASSAFTFWNKNHATQERPKTSQYFFKAFKPFYYGGRVQCFKKGIISTPFKAFDINSAYPYAMQFEHPYGDLYKKDRKLNEKEIEKCFIQFRGTSRGVLPFRDGGKLHFPEDDSIRTYFATGHELKLGLERNLVKIDKIENIYNFQRTINFKSYVDYFYTKKAELKDIDEARYLLVKLYLNSLYGKFGQSSLDHENFSLVPLPDIQKTLENRENSRFVCELAQNALMSEPVIEEKMKFFNVATAASITGFVRAYLYDQILKVKNPIYCDTDCIVCEDGDFNTGEKLGQWGFEGNYKYGGIGGKKLYAFEYTTPKKNKKTGEIITHKISSKGVRLNACDILTIANGGEISYKNSAPTFSIHKPPDFLVRKIRMT